MNEQMYSVTYTSVKDGADYSFTLFGTEVEANQHAYNLDGEYGLLLGIVTLPKDFFIDEPAKVEWD